MLRSFKHAEPATRAGIGRWSPRLLLLVIACAAIGVLPACNSPQKTNDLDTTDLQQKIGPGEVTPAEIRAEIMSFADGHVVRVAEALDKAMMIVETDDHRARVAGYKVSACYGAYILATAPNPLAGMIDLAVVVTLGRQALEDYWKPQVLGAAADRMIEQQRLSEREIWRICGRALHPDQIEGLRRMIENYRESNPDMWYSSFARVSEISALRAQLQTTSTPRQRSLLTVLRLDPLANLDPTTRELERSRLLAERAFYFLQRAPLLLEMQVESAQYYAASSPAVVEAREGLQEALATTAELKEIAARYPEEISWIVANERTALVADMAEAVRVEREAAIDQLFTRVEQEREATLEALGEPREELEGLLDELQATLAAGTVLSDSLHGTVDALTESGLVGRERPVGPDGQPIRGGMDYEQVRLMLDATTTAAAQLDSLVKSIEEAAGAEGRTLGGIQTTMSDFEAASRRIVNRVFTLFAVVIFPLFVILIAVIIFARRRT